MYNTLRNRRAKKRRSKKCRKCNKIHRIQIGCSRRKKNKRSMRINRRTFRRSQKKRGGYGPASNPFVGPSWNGTDNGNYYATSNFGVSPGGIAPYYAKNATPSPQHGGAFFSDPYNSAVTYLGNLGNQYNGNRKVASPSPTVQTLH